MTCIFSEVEQECLKYFDNDVLATSVVMNKYLLKNNNDEFVEKSPLDMMKRLATEFARIESRYENPLTYDEIFDLLKDFKYVVPGGSPLFGIGNNYKTISLSNCFVIAPPEDTYSSILDADKSLVQLMKRRGGVGIDLSNLRPRGSLVNNAAKTSDGITCFMDRYSNTTKEVAQNGRRGALIISLDCNHPDLEDFIKIKNDKTRVTGANISIKWNNDFMRAIENDEEYILRFPVDVSPEEATLTKTVKAREIWNLFVKNNYDSAEPGCLFWDTIINNSLSDCYKDYGFESVGTNPCLTGDTKIQTNKGLVSIKTLIETGIENYEILTYDTKTNKLEFEQIIAGQKTRENSEIITLELDDGEILKLTPDHKVYTKNRGYVEAQDLTESDSLVSINNRNKIKHILKSDNEDVYDLTTAKNHNFFANTVLVHNCAELPLSKNAACELMAINLTSFIDNPFTKEAKFNFTLFKKIVMQANRLIDDMIDLEIEKINKIINKIKSDDIYDQHEIELWESIERVHLLGRRVGLGVLGLADALAMLNLQYASDEALNQIEKIFKKFHETLMISQWTLAKERGAFEVWNWDLEKDCVYIKNLPPSIQEKIKQYGRRNISFSTIAPTGSISILAQTSSGIEPIFMREYQRRRKLQSDELEQGVTPNFIDDEGVKWISYTVYHHNLEKWKKLHPNKDISKSPYANSEAGELDWRYRVKLQGLINKYITHSISSTCNLNKNISIDDVSELYLLAWKTECKGITIYRDGSRDGVLISNNQTKDVQCVERPKILSCDIHYSTIEGNPWIFFVGLLDGKPYEILGGKRTNIEIPKKYKTGWISKNGKIDKVRTYDLILGSLENEEEQLIIKDIGHIFSVDNSSFTRNVSMSLRYNIPINIICEQLHKDGEHNMFSFAKGVARVLKKYIKDGTEGGACPECDSKLIYKDGCVSCIQCGFSLCN